VKSIISNLRKVYCTYKTTNDNLLIFIYSKYKLLIIIQLRFFMVILLFTFAV
jgi:hypothetical protein